MHRNRLEPWLLGALLSLVGCGGAGGPGGLEIANGGIGGTGTGTVTGFGSIIVGDLREFEFTPETEITINGAAAIESDLALGMVVQTILADDVNAELTRGSLVSVRVESLVRGPITRLEPLQVLGQDITVVADTVLAGVAEDQIQRLQLGDILEVHGYLDGARIRSSRLELLAGGSPVWRIQGEVRNLVSGVSLDLGQQRVVIENLPETACLRGLNNGALISVEIDRPVDFVAGQSIEAPRDLQCIDGPLLIPEQSSQEDLRASLEGFISALPATGNLHLNGQTVRYTGQTSIDGGSTADLVPGARIEVEGRLDTSLGILTATRIRLRETRVRIEGPIDPSAVTSGERISIFGIELLALPETEDSDGVLQGISDPIQIEVRGFVDRTGQVYLSQIENRGEPDDEDLRLRGPVSGFEPPLLEVLGVSVDTSGAVLRDRNGQTVDATTFFEQLTPGTLVDIQPADRVSQTNTLVGGEIEIED